VLGTTVPTRSVVVSLSDTVVVVDRVVVVVALEVVVTPGAVGLVEGADVQAPTRTARESHHVFRMRRQIPPAAGVETRQLVWIAPEGERTPAWIEIRAMGMAAGAF
jgi:hypothetical protein